MVYAGYGVMGPDARLQRPEFLGGSSQRINFYQVPQTSETGTTEQGNLAAYGETFHQGRGFSKSFVEHGVILGLAQVRADQTYSNGLPRMFTRDTRFDFAWPEFTNVGEQPIYGHEIWASGQGTREDGTEDWSIFGYTPRYQEYRTKPSMVTGLMRPTAASSLASWHLAYNFFPRPQLNAAFLEDNPPIDRVVAVPSEPEVLLDAYFEYTSVRPISLTGMPGMNRL